jgi:SAM-dependent methyltransferase
MLGGFVFQAQCRTDRGTMHDTAYELGKAFFSLYARPSMTSVIDVGSMDINGTLRECRPIGTEYTGVDIAAGKGVDVVIESTWRLPFENERFDLAVSSSCFEHDPMFWVTFLEMMRVVKPGGYAYLNVPSNGKYHAHPLDCWRFYPDSGLALEQWARHSGTEVRLIESFIADRRRFEWNDCVLIFAKGAPELPKGFLADRVPGARNIRKMGSAELLAPCEATEDQRLIRGLAARLRSALPSPPSGVR